MKFNNARQEQKSYLSVNIRCALSDNSESPRSNHHRQQQASERLNLIKVHSAGRRNEVCARKQEVLCRETVDKEMKIERQTARNIHIIKSFEIFRPINLFTKSSKTFLPSPSTEMNSHVQFSFLLFLDDNDKFEKKSLELQAAIREEDEREGLRATGCVARGLSTADPPTSF